MCMELCYIQLHKQPWSCTFSHVYRSNNNHHNRHVSRLIKKIRKKHKCCVKIWQIKLLTKSITFCGIIFRSWDSKYHDCEGNNQQENKIGFHFDRLFVIFIFYFVSKDFFETEEQFRTEAGGVYILDEFL